MTQIHDEELVEALASKMWEDGVTGKMYCQKMARDYLAIIEPLITHKAKEEGKAELLKQMMEKAVESFDTSPAMPRWQDAGEFLEDFATEQGINIEKGEG